MKDYFVAEDGYRTDSFEDEIFESSNEYGDDGYEDDECGSEDYERDEFESEKNTEKKVFVLIIYDIIDNKKRVKFAKLLQGYGFRVQKSSFEALITRQKYKKLLAEIPPFVSEMDSVRVYRLRGQTEVVRFGRDDVIETEDLIYI